MNEKRQTPHHHLADEHRLAALYESIPIALGFSLNGILFDANPAYLRMFGYDSIDELRGTNILKQIAPRCHSTIQENIQKQAANKPLAEIYETVGVRKDGSEFPFRCTVGLGHSVEGPLTLIAIEDLTELRYSEERIREASEFESLLISASPIGIFAYRSDGQCVAANEAAGRMIGATPEQLKALNFRKIESWRASGLLDLAEKALQSGITQSGDVHLITTFGREVWLACHLTRFQKSGQQYLLVQIIDVTDRALAEKKLRSSEERYRAIVDTAQEGIAASDAQFRITYLNKRFSELLGYDRTELLGRYFIELLHEDDRPKVLRQLERRKAGESATYELRYRRKDGQTILHTLVSSHPTFDFHGKFTGAVALMTDISERKRAEDTLKRSELNLARAQRISGVGSWSRNLKSGELHFSKEMFRILGLDAGSEVDFRSIVALVHPEDRARMLQTVERSIAEHGPYGIDYRIIRHDGSERLCRAEADLIMDESGNPAELVGILQDVTEARRQQAHINELLQREQVARLDAELANRTKDLFLATLSHELRTPLTSILGWTQLLRRARTDADSMKRGLEVIEQSARLQSQLVDDLLDISRIIANKLSIEPQLMSPVPTIRESVESFAAVAAVKHLQISTDIDPAAIQIYADPARLRQAVCNLLGNAIKFTPNDGSVFVRLRQEGARISITVSDTGIGIEPQLLPRIFDRFTQGDSSSTRRYGGLGLGLAISSYLIRMMGGTIRAESSGLNKGATFTISLPTSGPSQNESAFPDSSKRSASSPGAAVVEQIKGRRILLIDDDLNALDVLRQLIASQGARVETASSASEALRIFTEFRPDLIISDIAMPEMDGYALIRKIRELPHEAGGMTPAIALTAYAAKEDMRRALTSGFQGYLAKPVDIERLYQAIADLASRN